MRALCHRRRRLHRLEPRRRPARARRRGDVVDDLSTGRRENLDGALGDGRRAASRLDIRDAEALRRPSWSACGPRSSSTWRRRSTCASRWPTPPSTPRINVVGTINCSSAAHARGRAALRQHLHRRRDLRRGPGHPGARGPPGGARGALRPVEVLRRGLLPSSSAACTACRPSRCATATSTARARTRSARPA